MEKHLINRRAQQMEAEGVEFRTSVEVGVMVSMDSLRENYDAVVLAGGAEHPRPLEIPGSELSGVRFAMEFLTQQNKRVAGDDEVRAAPRGSIRSEEHTSELQSLMRTSYAVFLLKKKIQE